MSYGSRKREGTGSSLERCGLELEYTRASGGMVYERQIRVRSTLLIEARSCPQLSGRVKL
jgi:hypothetical protein